MVPKFSNSRIVAFDSIATAPAEKSRLVEFLTLASDAGVAIFHLALIRPQILMQGFALKDVLGNSRILKVGVGVEAQRRLLGHGPQIQLENAVELGVHAEHDDGLPSESCHDKHGRIISSMAAKILGSTVPTHDLSYTLRQLQITKSGTNQRIRKVGVVDPIQVITCKSQSF